MVLEFNKLLVKLKKLLSTQVALGNKLLLCVGENLFPMTHDR
jgi:hypothetical protein